MKTMRLQEALKLGVDGVMAYTGQADGAMPNGTRIVKGGRCEPGDQHEPGAPGAVVGSLLIRSTASSAFALRSPRFDPSAR